MASLSSGPIQFLREKLKERPFEFKRFCLMSVFKNVNPFHATGLFRYPLKTSENLWFPDVFRGYRKRLVAEMS